MNVSRTNLFGLLVLVALPSLSACGGIHQTLARENHFPTGPRGPFGPEYVKVQSPKLAGGDLEGALFTGTWQDALSGATVDKWVPLSATDKREFQVKRLTSQAGLDISTNPCVPASVSKTTPVLLYEVQVKKDGSWKSACDKEDYIPLTGDCEDPDKYPKHKEHYLGSAIAANGIWPSGKIVEAPAECKTRGCFALSCSSAVLFKCTNWGYVPENSDYLKGTLLQDHFNACVNAARADYRGNLTTPWTRKDTKVDVMDNIGIQNSDSPDGFSYEAAWGKTGTADAPVYKAIVPQVKVGDIVTAIDQFKPRFAKCADQIPQAKADEPKANPNYKLPPGVTLPMLFTDKSHPALIVIQSIANTAVECTSAGPDDSR